MDVLEECLMNRIKQGLNILIIGPGGTGKSTLIKRVTSRMNLQEIAITSSTGVSAININGQTLHRFFGVGLANESFEKIITRVKRGVARKNIKQVKTLFIDEISMISAELFTILDGVAKYIRNSTDNFGGIQIVASGDFMQLSPVNGSWIFTSKIWKEMKFKPFILSTPFRYEDSSFYETLMRVRLGDLTEDDIKKIKTRQEAYKEYRKVSHKTGVIPTKLFSTRNDVEEINKKELERLPGEYIYFTAQDTIIKKNVRIPNEICEKHLDLLAPKEIMVKIGAQIMITWNIDVENKISNGTRGVLKNNTENGILVTLRDNRDIEIPSIEYKYENDEVVLVRMQYPIIIAYALTIHKCQGSTLDFCMIDIGPKIFAPGQAYVALSRTRGWNNLLIRRFNASSIKADKHALRYITHLCGNIPPQTPYT